MLLFYGLIVLRVQVRVDKFLLVYIYTISFEIVLFIMTRIVPLLGMLLVEFCYTILY